MIIKQVQEQVVDSCNSPKTYEGLKLLGEGCWESHGFRKEEIVVSVSLGNCTYTYKIEPGQ